MQEIIPIIRSAQQNNTLFFIGMSLLVFLLIVKAIFFKRYFTLLNFDKYIEVRQNSAIYLFLISFVYSLILAFLFLFLYKSNDLSTEILSSYIGISLAILAMVTIQSFVYSTLWYILSFKPGSLEVLYNTISYVKTWKIIFFTAGFFLYYFSIIPNNIVMNGILVIFGLIYAIYFIVLTNSLRAHGVTTLHAILYLFLLEVFPVLFIYSLITKMAA